MSISSLDNTSYSLSALLQQQRQKKASETSAADGTSSSTADAGFLSLIAQQQQTSGSGISFGATGGGLKASPNEGEWSGTVGLAKKSSSVGGAIRS